MIVICFVIDVSLRQDKSVETGGHWVSHSGKLEDPRDSHKRYPYDKGERAHQCLEIERKHASRYVPARSEVESCNVKEIAYIYSPNWLCTYGV